MYQSEEMVNSTIRMGKEKDILSEETLWTSDEPTERLPSHDHQGWLYHDGQGYYYYCHQINKALNRRILKCCEKDCKALAWLEEKQKAAITRAAGSVLHNHGPDMQKRELLLCLHRVTTRVSSEAIPLTTILEEEIQRDPNAAKLFSDEKIKDMLDNLNVSKYFKDDIEIEEEIVARCSPEPSEMLYSLTSCHPIYSDGKGFYYRDLSRTPQKQHLVCFWPLCKAQAFILEQDKSKVYLPANLSQHNHEADPFYRNKLMFVHNLRQRILNEDTPVNVIYNEEANREPIGADMINDVSIKNFIYKLRKSRTVEGEFGDLDLALFGHFEENKNVPNQAHVHETEDIHKRSIPEKIPSLTKETFWHAAGFFYLPYRSSYSGPCEIVRCKCADLGCSARCQIIIKPGEPPTFRQTHPAHSHPADPQRRDQLLFINLCKHRAAECSGTVDSIYNEEEAKYPHVAKQLSASRVKEAMTTAKKACLKTLDMSGNNEDSVDDDNESVSEISELRGEEEERNKTKPAVPTEFFTSENFEEKIIDYGSGLYHKDIPKTKKDNKKFTVKSQIKIGPKFFKIAQIEEETHSVENNSDSENCSEAVYSDFVTLEGELDDPNQDEEDIETTPLCLYESTSQQPNFCDDEGFCFQQTTVRRGIRYLKCIEEDCKVKASMKAEKTSAAIILSRQTPFHNHPSKYTMLLEPGQLLEDSREQRDQSHLQEVISSKRSYRQRQKPQLTIDTDESVISTNTVEVDEAASDDYYNEDQQKYPLKPAEVIPGLRPDANNYHDGNGFYYELNRVSHIIRYLKCLTKNCRARAYMEIGKENAPIIQTNFAKHNHGPDLLRKQFTVFLHRITHRAAEENTPISVIYEEEATRDPVSASQIRMENVKQRMVRYRRKQRHTNVSNCQELAGAGGDMDGSIFRHLLKENERVNVSPFPECYTQEKRVSKEREISDSYEQDQSLNHEEDESLDELMPHETYVINEIEMESNSQTY